jgi:hypothetical protein
MLSLLIYVGSIGRRVMKLQESSQDASYIRLKNLEVGYRFSGALLNKLKCQSMREYINGTNLITWDRQKLFKYDPEQPGGRWVYYQQVKIYNLGINLQF